MDLGLSLRLKNNFAAGTGGVVESWWLSGGVSASDCLAAYQSISADSYAASKVNLANPGTYDITNGASYPTWNAATGWTFDGIDDYLDTNLPGIKTATTIIIYIDEFSPLNTNINYFISCTDDGWNSETSIDFSYSTDPINEWRDYYNLLYNGKWIYEFNSLVTNEPYIFGMSPSARYRNGVKTAFFPPTTDDYSETLRTYILGAIWGGAAYTGFGSANILAVAIYNTTLTDDQVSAITTALQAL